MLGHHEAVKLLAEKSATMMTNGINLTNGTGKSETIVWFFQRISMEYLNRIFKFTSRLCLESIRGC
jgi:hypothetical protein